MTIRTRSRADFYIGEYGQLFTADAGGLIDTAASAVIVFQKPDRATEVTKTATVGSSTRYWNYTVESGVFDVVGKWYYQLEVTLASGRTISAEGEFDVGRRLSA